MAVTHREWPVYVYDTHINGFNFTGHPKAVASGWDWPKGGSPYVGSMGYSEDKDTVFISASWTELFSNKGWKAKVSFPLSKMPTQKSGKHIRLVVGYGVNGEFVVHGKKEDDSAPVDLDIEMAFVCGERAPELDHDFRPDIERKLDYFYYNREGSPVPPSRCPESQE